MVQVAGHDMLKARGISLIAASAQTFFLETATFKRLPRGRYTNANDNFTRILLPRSRSKDRRIVSKLFNHSPSVGRILKRDVFDEVADRLCFSDLESKGRHIWPSRFNKVADRPETGSTELARKKTAKIARSVYNPMTIEALASTCDSQSRPRVGRKNPLVHHDGVRMRARPPSLAISVLTRHRPCPQIRRR